MKIDLISQGRENVLFLPSNMAAMTSHEKLAYQKDIYSVYLSYIYYWMTENIHLNLTRRILDILYSAQHGNQHEDAFA